MDNKKKIILTIIPIIIILAITTILSIYFKMIDDFNKATFKLNGEETITLEVGKEYKEPGYIAIVNNKDKENDVKILSNLNINAVGDYEINYTLDFNKIKKQKGLKRKIKVVDTTKPVLTVEGKTQITIQVGDKFQTPSYKAIDNVDGNITKNVKVTSNVNTKKAGKYTIKYSVEDSSSNKEEKTINVFDDHFHDSGSIHVDSARIKCWKKGGHGDQTFLQVVENSCNPGFVVMGQKLGTERLYKYITNFGFGEKTGIDLNGESSGILFKYDNIGPVEQATMSFGQGISVTPIQQIQGVSAAINGGYLNTPFIVKYLSEPETNTIILENKKNTKKQVISEETSKLVRHVLESVVANGTGKNAYIENYRVGGKTGTAQKVNNGTYMVGNYILSFIGFLPANKPEYLVYVAIDNPKGVTQYGGTVSAPIAKNVMKSIIDIKEIKQDNTGMIRQEYTWLDTKYIMLPDVVGMDLKTAQTTLKGFKIEYTGSGDKVIEQVPSANQYVKETNTIKLMLG